MTDQVRQVLVAPARLERWVAGFGVTHGELTWSLREGVCHVAAADGSWAAFQAPFDGTATHPDVASVLRACLPPVEWAVLLVRKGGFGVAHLRGGELVASKVGSRHVQGRSKAGGQSQQRFARRRDNQAQAAYDAAADHAARLLGGRTLPVVVGGDPLALDSVLADPRLSGLTVVGHRLAVMDPKQHVLLRAIEDAAAVLVRVYNAD